MGTSGNTIANDLVERWDQVQKLVQWQDEPIVIAPALPRDDSSRESIVDLYRRAFGSPPYTRSPAQVAAFREELRTHVQRDGFTAFQATAGGDLLGFGYGYTTSPRHRWHQNVLASLGPRAGRWLTDSFAFAELAVDPDVQRFGLGRALHDQVLTAQPHPRAVLSTLAAPTPARAMYATAGWRLLADNVRFPVSTERYVILGKQLR